MAYIFTHGQCKRKELYDVILNSLIGAGWTNISSNIVDGDVLVSIGVTGTKSLVMQLFPYDAGNYGASAANASNASYSVRTGSIGAVNHIIGVRLPMKYTPGTSGAAGTILNTSQPISRMAMININAIVDLNTVVDYDIYCDKNRIMMATRVANIFSTSYQLFHIGLPDTMYTKCNDARGMVLCNNSGNMGDNRIVMSDFPDISLGSNGTWYTCSWAAIIPARTPNVNGTYFLAEPYFHTDVVGIIGKIDGVYMITSGSQLANESIVTVGNSKFKAINFPNMIPGFNQAWPSTAALIQIQ